MNEQQSQMMNQSQLLNQAQMLNQPQLVMNQSQMLMTQNQPPPLMNQPPQMMSQNQPVLMNQPQVVMNRSYGLWAHQQAQAGKAAMNPMKYQTALKPTFTASQSSSSMPGRSNNWKGKKGTNNRIDGRRNELQKQKSIANSGMKSVIPGSGGGNTGGGYKPPTLQELQSQNRLKARRFYPKKKFNNRFAPYAPRNTTSFIIRAKKSGGIASLVSPCPVTPAVLPTPIFSPSREVLGDMAKEEWGVDGYGSMKGLIRLRSPGHEAEMHDEDDDEDGGSSESDVEEHVEVERRLDHDLSRFEMVYPNCEVGYNNLLENRVDDQDTHIAQLEEENLTLKERLFLMEREFGDLRRRLQYLERHNHNMHDLNEEVVENGSDNESESSEKGNFHALIGQNNEEVLQHVAGNESSSGADVGAGENNEEVGEFMSGNEGKEVNAKENNDEAVNVCMEELVIAPEKEVIADEDKFKDSEEGNGCSTP